MEWLGTEGLNLALRWFHVVAVITWIGHAYFFNWLDRSLTKPERGPEGGSAGSGSAGSVEGELWMVHSGGFYRVEKITTAPDAMPALLHWFKWESALAWLSGFLLLGVTYYHGSAMIVDPGLTDLGAGTIKIIGLASMLAGWVFYDQVYCRVFAGRLLAVPVGIGLIVALAWGLGQVMSGRAMYVHVGAVLGTVMVASVWVRIIPAQKALVAATKAGTTPDPTLGEKAKQRSVHNNYLSLPVVFVMVSNHFVSTYGHDQAWLVLALLVGAGMGVRRLMNTQNAGAPAVAALVVAAIAATAWVQHVPSDDDYDLGGGSGAVSSEPGSGGAMTGAGEDGNAVGDAAGSAAGDGAGGASGATASAGATGTVRGTIQLSGTPPKREPMELLSECHAGHEGGVVVPDDVLVVDGLLQNAFVVLRGVDASAAPSAPSDEVVLDQVGCMYTPRVIGVRAGQPFTLVNSDDVLHNVHAVPQVNRGFNIGMPTRGMRVTKRFRRPEEMFRIKCDVHPWMGAWIGVVEHPWFAVTDPSGGFELTGVPVGTYELEVWHEVFGKQTREIVVTEGAVVDGGLALDAR